MVRRAIAQILPELCDIYEEQFFLSELQPMLYMFLADDIVNQIEKYFCQLDNQIHYKKRDSQKIINDLE